MSSLLTIMLWIVALLIGGAAAWFAIASSREGEPRAARLATMTGVLLVLPLALVAATDFSGRDTVASVFLGACVLTLAACLWPDHRPGLPTRVQPGSRVDERDTMFSRRELNPGTERYTTYYDRHPEHLELDERWRHKPGLMSSGSRYAHPLAFAAADGTFSTVEALQSLVEGEPAAEKELLSPEEASVFLCAWARNLGALDAGVTELLPYHVYTTGGRRERYGRPIDLDHPFAIAFTVEMDHRMMQSAPASPTLMESARQYLNAGSIAVQLAVAIRALGYRARAHIDANYQVICPIVARDAGLGEIGRMGLLMTPTHGPRVRIGVVTTDMPLMPSDPAPEPSIEEFCRLCEKCAKVCPSQAIPYGDREDQPEPGHWRIDAESCFSYWCDAGTDCGRCVITCPYAHPDTLLHRMVRLAIRRSPFVRRLAAPLDDLAYGVRPASSPIPGWLDVRRREH